MAANSRDLQLIELKDMISQNPERNDRKTAGRE